MPVYTYCDDDAHHAEITKASSLTPNRFHKICPGAHVQMDGSYSELGQPRCGDGSNFSFFFSRPLKQLANDRKIMIEFMGGGACWNMGTCSMQKDYLSFPNTFDSFVGMSCSEIEYGAATKGGRALSMLCSKTIGWTDFREYNTIVVPYCTQDVHLGDASNISYDGDNIVRHVGAHNMIRTLNWVFSNFPNPTNIFLTGCSAGGTAVPIAYDLINKHYNSFLKGGSRSVNINTIMDSSVYLTPPNFLQYGYSNWNPKTIMEMIGFHYETLKREENYPDLVWDHVLRRGSNSDRWGFVTHSSDPVSLLYYQYMNGDENGDRSLLLASSFDGSIASPNDVEGHGRHMTNSLESQWWTEINSSMEYIKTRHKNVKTYIIDGEGHCTFGLYYPLQEEQFDEWAAIIVKENLVLSSSVAFLLTSVVLGGILIASTLRLDRKKGSLIENGRVDPNYLNENPTMTANRVHVRFIIEKVGTVVRPLAAKCCLCPWTAGYLVATSIYFTGMLISQGFTHPLDNPAIGPSAVGLSAFGINNPALIIYRMEHFRLITSTFVCSGLFTFLLLTYTLCKTGLEAAMSASNHPHWHFLLVSALLSSATNLFYACIGNGASCTSLALVLGLNVVSTTLSFRRRSNSYTCPWRFTTIAVILGSTPLFPFDSVVALTASIVAGIIIGLAIFAEEQTGEKSDLEIDYHRPSFRENVVNEEEKSTVPMIRWLFVRGIIIVYFLMYLLVLFRVPSPDKDNINAYRTGCNLAYSDQIENFVNAYASDGGRDLEEAGNEIDGLCAQLCIPHLIYRPALRGALFVHVAKGGCQDNSYSTHVADKTFQKYSVVLEVNLFTA